MQEHGNLSINSLTITNGYADEGGAIKAESGTVLSLTGSTIQNSEAHSSAAGDGGGILCDNCTATVTGSVIANNEAADDGGGIRSSGAFTITNSTVRDNSSVGDGGGIWVQMPATSAWLTITGSTLSGNATNSGEQGGAIFNNGASGSLDITNSTIYDNSATGGGAIWQFQGTMNLTHVTIVNNRSGANTGAVRKETGTMNLRNSIIAGTTTDGSTRARDCRDTNSDHLTRIAGIWSKMAGVRQHTTAIPAWHPRPKARQLTIPCS